MDARAKVTLEDTPNPNLEPPKSETAASEAAPAATEDETNTAAVASGKGAEGAAPGTENPSEGEVQSTLF
jgi:hypothetical protein